VLGGLGSDYNSFVVASNTKDQLSFIELQAMLRSYENLLQPQTGSTSLPSSQNSIAFYVSSKPGPPRNNYKPNRGGFRPKGQAFPQPPLLQTPHHGPHFPSTNKPNFSKPSFSNHLSLVLGLIQSDRPLSNLF
jgi:hypothetical protein